MIAFDLGGNHVVHSLMFQECSSVRSWDVSSEVVRVYSSDSPSDSWTQQVQFYKTSATSWLSYQLIELPSAIAARYWKLEIEKKHGSDGTSVGRVQFLRRPITVAPPQLRSSCAHGLKTVLFKLYSLTLLYHARASSGAASRHAATSGTEALHIT